MDSQLFKTKIPLQLLYDILDKISQTQTHSMYVFDLIAFKKGMFNNHIVPFFELCRPYYHISKQKFVNTKKITFNTFATVVRQICNLHDILYETQIKYNKSQYEIVYSIYKHDGKGIVANRILPNDATAYLTTKGKSFSK